MNLPERFDLTYIGPDGEKHRPVMIHRVVFGSIERFIGILTEHFAGAFPLWLAPVQAQHDSPSPTAPTRPPQGCRRSWRTPASAPRSTCATRRSASRSARRSVQKIPYMLVLGDKEAENGVVAVRKRGEGDVGQMTPDELLARLKEEIRTKAR